MFEPTFIPQLQKFPLSLADVQFYVERNNRFIDPSDPTIEGTHIHEYTELIVYVQGAMSFFVNGQLYDLQKGDIVVSKPNTMHVGLFQKAENYEYFCVWIDADENSPLLLFLKNMRSAILSFDEQTREKIYALLLSVANESNTSPLQKTADFLQFLSILQRSPTRKKSQNPLPPQMQAVLNDIHNNAADIAHAQDLCTRHFLSHATLDRWFKRYLHISPRAFLEAEKLAFASRLLASGANVTDACMQSGFSDCSYFIAIFKKKFGETPLQYKRKFH